MDEKKCKSNIQTQEEYNRRVQDDIVSLQCDECENFTYYNGIGLCTKFNK